MNEDKIILVTGGARGIGRSISTKLSQSGYMVAITYNSSEEEAKQLESNYSNIRAFRADVTKRSEIGELIKQVHEEMGTINGIVNNAGIWHLFDMDNFDEKKYDQIMNTNVKGAIFTILESLSDLKKNKGVIINIASNAGVGTSAMNTTFYSMSKASLIMLTKRLALEFEPYEIRCNAIAPGWINTDLTTGGRSQEEISKIEESFINRQTVKRVGKTGDIAELSLYLISEKSSFINGQVIVIDGGRKDNLTHSI